MPDVTTTRPLAGQVALITGATAGIGRATAAKLACLGANIAFTYRDPDRADAMTRQLPADCEHVAVRADLGLADDVRSIVPAAIEGLGGVDVLVNCAAEFDNSELLEQDLDSWLRLLAVNLTAPFLLMQDAARSMIDRGGGRIINVSSSSAFRAEFTPPAYVSSKGGLNALTRAGAGALGKYGINVNGVVPGVTRTDVLNLRYPDEASAAAAVSEGPLKNLLRRMSEPEDVADTIAFLCLPTSRQITGQLIHVSAGAVV